MKRLYGIFAAGRCAARALRAALPALGFMAAASGTAGAAECERIRIASSSNEELETNGVYVWLNTFIKELRDQGCDVQFYPNSSLGNEEQRTELVELNLLHVNVSGRQVIDDMSPLYTGLTLPFLFDDYRHFDRFLHESAFLEDANRDLAPANLYIVDIALLGGMSGLFNTKHEIRSPEDFDGLRIRAMSSGDLALLNSWDIPATQVAWEEISQAMQTGIVDGYINPPLVPLMFGHNRQIKYFADLRLSPSGRQVVLSREWYLGLSPHMRSAVDTAIAKARAVNRRWNVDIMKRETAALEEAGVKVARLTDEERSVFVRLTQAQYDKIVPPETIDLITPYVEASRDAP